MHTFATVQELQEHLQKLRRQATTIGFVPTMGALHDGHLSLIRAAKQRSDHTVCSIFVNPAQFDDDGDLARYPRTLDKDRYLLIQQGNDSLFAPSTTEVYPSNLQPTPAFDFGEMTMVMEGAHRPGHFDGVVQVVHRLLEIVAPNRIYMGQKDFQQQAIIRALLRKMDKGTSLVMCPIVREPDGLAMSSRNVHLNTEERRLAPLIHQTLQRARQEAQTMPLAAVRERALQRLNIPQFSVDYFEIVDGESLMPVAKLDEASMVVACTTVRLGKVRLLDNILLKP